MPTITPNHVNPFLAYAQSTRDSNVGELSELLAIPTVGVLAAHDADMQRGAEWLIKKLESLGFKGEIIETSGKPIVFAEPKTIDPSAPTVLVYGHYDVQPVKPDQWDTDPFNPVLKSDGRIYARGAQDNKGQLMLMIKAIEAAQKLGISVCNVKFAIEGEEENGSRGFLEALPTLAEKLKTDYVLVCDSESPRDGVGSVTLGLRGIVKLDAVISGADSPLHSGTYGGVIPNAQRAWDQVKNAIDPHYNDGVTGCGIPGFYDGILMPPAEILARAALFDMTPKDYEAVTGLAPFDLEAGTSYSQLRGLTPCISINGEAAGHHGEGFSTIIPDKVVVKLSIRVPPGQDPERHKGNLLSFISERLPSGFEFLINSVGTGNPVAVDPTTPVSKLAQECSDLVSKGNQGALVYSGGSIPVVEALGRILDAPTVLFGFGLAEDRIHGNNESFSMDQYRRGVGAIGAFLSNAPLRNE